MTLIELMVTVAIVAILAAIAYPSYQDQVRRSRRAAAAAWLMEVSARQQQRIVDVRSYAASYAALSMTTPVEVSPYYTIAVVGAASPPTFSVTATPTGAQVGERCGVLAIDQAGNKTAGGVARADCW